MLTANRKPPLRILMVAAEFAPFAKTGGLADVLASLPKALARRGLDVRVAIPRYGSVDLTGVSRRPGIARFDLPFNGREEPVRLDAVEVDGFEVLLIDNEHYVSARPAIYGYPDDGHRFTFFARAALESARMLDWRPDVIHCHDWHTGLIPNWLRTTDRDAPEFTDTASVFTIHNLEYQGHFDQSVLEAAGLASNGLIPHPTRADLSDVLVFIARGILFADKVSTVSPRYAGEILTPAFGHDLDPLLRDREPDLHGILNGIDTDSADPATDPRLASHYAVEDPRLSSCQQGRPPGGRRPPGPSQYPPAGHGHAPRRAQGPRPPPGLPPPHPGPRRPTRRARPRRTPLRRGPPRTGPRPP